MATIRDVAKEAGVAVCTVSFAMNGSAHVSEKTKKRIFEAIERLNYRPNQSARGLVKKKTNNIGLAVPQSIDFIENTLFSELIKGLGQATVERNYDLIISFQKSFEPGKENEHVLDAFRKRTADGLILVPAKMTGQIYKEMYEQRFPVVVLGNPIEDIDCISVNADNVDAAYRATEHLLQRGHRRIAFITPCSPELEAAADRLEGYRKAMADWSCEVDDRLIEYGSYEPDIGYAETERLLGLSPAPTAIIAGRDELASRVLKVAQQRDVVVPDDLAIVSFENSLLSQVAHPSITSVDFPMREMGYQAAIHLIDLIEGNILWDEMEHIKLPCNLVERESSQGTR